MPAHGQNQEYNDINAWMSTLPYGVSYWLFIRTIGLHYSDVEIIINSEYESLRDTEVNIRELFVPFYWVIFSAPRMS